MTKPPKGQPSAVQEAIWREQYKRLTAYHQKYGHCSVTQKENPQLAGWLENQRKQRTLTRLAPERVALLDRLGFRWKQQKPLLHWDQMYERLRAFHQTHGHCHTPATSAEQQQLHGWMSIQRNRRDQASLSQQKIAKLSSLGFHWETLSQRLERQWNELFDRLKAYKARTGDCNVPTSPRGCYTQDPALATWVSSQRFIQTRDALSPIQKGKLDEIGFVWCVDNDNKWDAMYAKLVDFHAHHGHPDVPLRYDQPLAKWAKKQRNDVRTGKLPDNHVAKLDQLTFVWETRSERNETSWMELFERLKWYQLEHGDCLVPKYYTDRKLYNWLTVQRRRYKHDKLPQHRVEKLHSVGFVAIDIDTSPVDDQWIEF